MKPILALMSLTLLTLLPPSEAHARDWFVRAGSNGGDGSRDKPFNDPWQALGVCEANDAIHITAGKYYGRSGEGAWTIPFDGIQLLGGYDRDFKERDPWKNHSELLWDKDSKNWPKDARVHSNAKNVVIDGLVLDMKDQIQYADAKMTGRTEKSSEDAIHISQAATIRNNVIINPGNYGIACMPGSTVENNLILNAMGWAVSIPSNTGDFARNTATIRNNTILFTWTLKKAGGGGYAGSALHINGPANITNNILAYSDNHGVYQTYKAEKIAVTNNIFFANLFSNLKFYVESRDSTVDDKTMDLLEEVGLKAFDGNEVKNPQLDLDPLWMDRFSKRAAGTEGKLEKSDWNEVRRSLGLPMIASGGEPPSGVAPPWDLEKALKLLTPKGAIKQGARRQKLEVKFQGGVSAGPAKSYNKTVLSSWSKQPDNVDNKEMEMTVALGPVANITGIPSQYKKDAHAGVFLHNADGQGDRITGFFKTGSSVERVVSNLHNVFSGQGTPERLFVVRGIAHVSTGHPKAAFYIESVEPLGAPTTSAARPQGRDWFVREGAKGGDGSREKPFKDPYQALEKCESGDTIHVTEGEYIGKLRAGYWRVDTTYITLLGGYDREFKTRNPWKHPSLFHSPADFKGRRASYTLEGAEDHTGTVVDGFVFDLKTSNVYQASGDLDHGHSEKRQHIWLARPQCVIRNCIFVNGPEGAVRLGASGQTVENNIFLNHVFWTVRAERGFNTDPMIFRNNTLAFSWDIRFRQGRGSGGNLLILEGGLRANVDNNIFEFADNDAIRLNAQASDVELTRNTFSHNLWSHVQKPSGWVSVDDKSWAQMADFGFKKLEGNSRDSAALPVDQKWFDVYLNRTAMVPGKVEMNDWNQLREILGQPVIATGGKAGGGFAPVYDWHKALALLPKNSKVTSGARAGDLPVKFTGMQRVDETAGLTFDETDWETAKNKDSWDKLDGKRVALKVVIRAEDNQYMLGDIKQDQYTCFTVAGPQGMDSGGLPLRVYVKKGTRFERAVKQAKGYHTGSPEETHLIKGTARNNRQMVADVVERAD